MTTNRNSNRGFRGNFSKDQYEAFKATANGNNLVHKEVLLSDLKIIDSKMIEWKGHFLRMSDGAFTTLVDFLGLTKRVISNVEKVLGEDDQKVLLEAMKRGMSNKEGKNALTLVINKVTQEIEYFQKSAKDFIPNGSFFKLFEDVMNNHTNMVISNMSLAKGCIEINVVNNDWEFNIGGLKDEFFKSGLSFVYTPNHIVISPFNERLICTNGMVTREKGLSLILKRNDAGSVSEFLEKVRDIKDNEYFVKEFRQRVNRMIKTTASVGELMFAHNTVAAHVDMEDVHSRTTIERFLPLMFVKAEYLKIRVDVDRLQAAQLAKAQTHLSVWEVVNGITDIASHEARYYLNFLHGNQSAQQMQRVAGEITFKQNFDLEISVPNPFENKNENETDASAE